MKISFVFYLPVVSALLNIETSALSMSVCSFFKVESFSTCDEQKVLLPFNLNHCNNLILLAIILIL